MDGSSTKEIEVAIKATGYEEDVKTFRVRRGKPFNWEFELRKKVPEIPESFKWEKTARGGLSGLTYPLGQRYRFEHTR